MGQAPPSEPRYGIRRIFALTLVLLVLVGFVWGVLWVIGWFTDQLSGDEDPAAPATGPTEYSTAQPEACAPEGLEWDLVTTSGQAGQPVDFRWTVKNNTGLNCTINAAPSNVALSVVSGTDPIWSSTHCGSSDTSLLLLAPGDETSRATRWAGERSQEGCTPVGSAVRPGTYQVTLTYEGMVATGGTGIFDLTPVPAPAPPSSGEGEAPADGEAPVDDAPADGEGEAPADGEAPAEGEAPADGEAPVGSAAPAEGEVPADGEAPDEGEG